MYPKPWSHSLFVSELALRSTRAYVVAKVGRDIVGYAGLMMSLSDGHVTTIAVEPTLHRHGIGTRLLLALAREGIARGATALTLEARLSNKPAQEMYRRFGFVPVGVRKGYYADTGEDALVMWAYEVDSPRVRRTARGPRTAGSGLDRVRATEVLVTRILGIETSCDETAAAVVDDGRIVLLVGRVEPGRPPRALRRRRARSREPRARRGDRRRHRGGTGRGRNRPRRTIDVMAAVHGPGLAGALIVGVSAAKALSVATGAAYVGVNHHEAHVYAALLEDPTLEPPLLTLIVSGGHTLLVAMEDHGKYRVLGQTVDDAAGEAFDKVARFLGLGLSGRPAHRSARARRRPGRDRRSRARCSTRATTSRSRA